MLADDSNQEQIEMVEREAEILTAHQLDLLGQIEHQLRCVHHTMRHIEKLRSAKHRVGPELSLDQKRDTLKHLSSDVTGLERQLDIQRQSCQEMQYIIQNMQARLKEMRQRLRLKIPPVDPIVPESPSG